MSKAGKPQPDVVEIEQAKRNAAVARARVQTTVGALKQRLNPRNIAADAKEKVRERTGAITGKASDAARKRPVAAGTAAGIATLIVFRKPVKKLARKLFGRNKKQPEQPNGKDEGIIRAGEPPKPSVTPRITRAVVESNASQLSKQESENGNNG
jgi:hypothetical protein